MNIPPCSDELRNVFSGSREVVANEVHYRLFDSRWASEPHPTIEAVEGVRQQWSQFISDQTRGYLWNDQPFNMSTSMSGSDIPFVSGRVRFGDALTDEWFIVSLLMKLSVKFPTMLAQISDNDGEFLLIEVASHLPEWLEPDTSEGRVWLHRGKLLIIPQSFSKEAPRVKLVLKHLSEDENDDIFSVFCSNDSVQSALQTKVQEHSYSTVNIKNAPKWSHRAWCRLSKCAAAVLQEYPEVVPCAVEAFYLRGPEDQRAITKMVFLGPSKAKFQAKTNKSVDVDEQRSGKNISQRPTDSLQRILVTFSRTLYAKLVRQDFFPPKVYNPYLLSGDFSSLDDSSKERKEILLGVKLAAGLEIILTKWKSQTSPVDAAEMKYSLSQDPDHRYQFAAYKIEQIRSSYLSGIDNEASLNTPKFEAEGVEDDDNWIHVLPEGLDKMMEKYAIDPEIEKEMMKRATSEANLCEDASEAASKSAQAQRSFEKLLKISEKKPSLNRNPKKDLNDASKLFDSSQLAGDISAAVNTFVNHESSVDGAEFPNDLSMNDDNNELFQGISAGSSGISSSGVSVDMSKLMKLLSGTSVCDDDDEEEEDDSHSDVDIDSNNSSDDPIVTEGDWSDLYKLMDAEIYDKTETSRKQHNRQYYKSTENTKNAQNTEDVADDVVSHAINAVEARDATKDELDINLVDNLLKSFKSQAGVSGPASSMLGRLGLSIPLDDSSNSNT